ncbi:hypothetical protein HZF05_08515 [Sphingomonas sp. CGMCC 1.13654]|uniref:Muconolactone isomerase domain-containing protein n=1 Tax=Sphingomonas chungangi TaxID=2683589 RepID=A0A838L679_9SPHN|nr:hypothetical protein [Sphingomonas chungangi]MBA2934142.1 hypothetical protein [Sphingomonas chungangi]MVW57183.1 hypothetical protein [Sphingomonas chungangi]
MKVFAIGSIVKPLSEEERERVLGKEVPHTLQLYLDGAIDQFWFRGDRPGPIFLMNAESVEAAKAVIDKMPIVAEGFAEYDYYPVGPLAPLGRLIQGL